MRTGHHRRRELLGHYGRISKWDASVFELATRPRGLDARRESHVTLHFEGEFMEPVNGVCHFTMQVSPTEMPEVGHVEVPTIGSFVSVKPTLQGVVDLASEQFEQLLILAVSGRVSWMYVALTPPFRRSAHIVSISFDTRPPDDDA